MKNQSTSDFVCRCSTFLLSVCSCFIASSLVPLQTSSSPLLLSSLLSQVCQCPLCKKTFQKRPDLQINRTLREITEQFRSMRGTGGGGGGVGREKRGGRGGGGMPDSFFDELKKKLPRPLPKVPVTLSSEAQGKTGESGFRFKVWIQR